MEKKKNPTSKKGGKPRGELTLYTHVYRYDYDESWSTVQAKIEAFLCGHEHCLDYFTTPIKGGLMFKIIYSGNLSDSVSFLSRTENAIPRTEEARLRWEMRNRSTSGNVPIYNVHGLLP